MARGQWRQSVRQFLDATARRGRRSGQRPDRRPRFHRPWFEILEGRLAPTVTLSIGDPVPFPKPDTGQYQGMFVVTRSGDLAPAVQVDYHTQDGTGSNGAHAGTDYVATTGTLYFASNQTMATIAIPIIGNNSFQADKMFTVSLSNPLPSAAFVPQQTFATGREPRSVEVGDFNGDGKPDLAVTNSFDNTVSVLLNTTPMGAAAPSFASQQTFTFGRGRSSVVLGDFNGDNKPDLAVTNSFDNTVSVLLNTTTAGATIPSFAPAVAFAAGTYSSGILVGDFNGDGKPDLAIGNLSVLLNTTPEGATTPSFAPPQTFATGFGWVAVGDFNGDGKPDLAGTNFQSEMVSVLLNTTTAGATIPSFAPQQTFTTDNFPSALAVGDFNGDGRPDLAIGSNAAGASMVSVMLNTTPTGATTPSFASQRTFATGSVPTSVAVGDFNGDGLPDLAVTNYSSNTVSVLLNTTSLGATTPSFATQQIFATNSGPGSVAVGDFNGDNKPDLAVTNYGTLMNPGNTVSVLLNVAIQTQIAISGSPAIGIISSAPPAPTAIAVIAGTTPQSAAITTAFATPLAVDVRNAGGHLVQGVSVTFTAPGSGPSGKFGSSTSVTVMTNATGRANAPAFVANTIAGSYTVTAQAAGGSNPSTTFNLTNTPGAPATLTATAGNSQSATVNSAFTTSLLATLTDQYGNRIPGVTLTFTAPARGASATFPSGNTATTDANGQVSKAITANTVAGIYGIQAAASGGSNPTATFMNLTNTPDAPAVLTAQAGYNQSTAVTTPFPGALTATLTDQYDNPVPGVTVTFIAPSFGASATFGGGNTSTTDALGRVGKAITANIVAGSYSITAIASGRNSPTTFFFNLTNTPTAPAGLAATIGSDQSITVNTRFTNNLWATVLDPYGNPVPGVLVTFTAPDSGASATFPSGNTATSNANGLVIIPITANTIAGSYSITAVASGGRNPMATFANLTNTPTAVDHLAVTTTAAADPDVAGTPFDVTVTVQDVYGNTVTDYAGTVTSSSADPYGATLPGDYTFQAADAGVHTFAGGATLYTAGTWDVTASDTNSGITGSASVNVQAAPAVALLVQAPATAPAGAAFDVTVIAQDPYGNTDTNYAGTVTWTTTDGDPRVVLPPDYTFGPGDQGMKTFPGGVTLYTPGDQTLTVTDTGSGISGSAVVTVTGGNDPLDPPSLSATSEPAPAAQPLNQILGNPRIAAPAVENLDREVAVDLGKAVAGAHRRSDVAPWDALLIDEVVQALLM